MIIAILLSCRCTEMYQHIPAPGLPARSVWGDSGHNRQSLDYATRIGEWEEKLLGHAVGIRSQSFPCPRLNTGGRDSSLAR